MTFQPHWERGGAPRPSRIVAIGSWTAVAVALVVVIALPFVEWSNRRPAETARTQSTPSTIGQGAAPGQAK
jgi:hypothetical protein